MARIRNFFALCLVLFWLVPTTSMAWDVGVYEHFLQLNTELPDPSRAIGEIQAREAAREHFSSMLQRRLSPDDPLSEYWQDYRSLLKRWSKPSTAKPVLIETEEGNALVARYLVGLEMGDQVGGFVAVDPRDGSIQSKLMWTPELKPLWTVDKAAWEGAESVNAIESLEELLPPYTQFTSGIPIDPRDPAFHIVDGIVDKMPFKTQEERKARIRWLNDTYETELRLPIKSKHGRRAATSKCMSVAASYVADWWTATTGHPLPSYKNPAGGQKEYGHNPRILEALFYAKNRERKLFGKWTGDWRTAPFAYDLVTGEPISYSLRGYARLLVETGAGSLPDPLIPSALTYETADNHYHMDQKPHLLKVFTEGVFTGNSIRKDMERLDDPDFPITVPDDYGTPVTAERLAQALDTWGVLLGQHMRRELDGDPADSAFGTGVHSVQIVGWGERDEKLWFVYRETFGETSRRYLEDSFLGPSFRIMPIEYFYQAFAFPHHLYLDLELEPRRGGGLVGHLTVTTNHQQDAVEPDRIEILVDGQPDKRTRVKKGTASGRFEIRLSPSTLRKANRIEVRAAKRYFADKEGRNGFRIAAAKRPDGSWLVEHGDLPPAAMVIE